MKFFGQLEEASLEQLSADPAANTQGRIFTNTTEGRSKIDDGVNKRALLRNDQKMIIGNDGTAANNVRIHKGPTGVIQDVNGGDTTAEGTSSTSIAQRTSRSENLANASLPANGNAGRKVWVTDLKAEAIDDGTGWRRTIPEFSADDATTGTTITLATIASSLVRLTGSFSTIQMIPAGFSGQRVTLINRSGGDVILSNDSGGTAANRILTGTNANIIFKSNSSLSLYYDSTTQRWQVVGEAAGSASGGGTIPNSVILSIVSDYTALITDDVFLVDTSTGPVTITIPSAAGNLGKRYLFEKVSGRQNNKLTIAGASINGSFNEEIWALNAPFDVISDGTDWVSISPVNGELFLTPSWNSLNGALNIAAASTGNVVLETMSVASSTNIDNVLPKAGNLILLKNQSAPEENGIYSFPATNITIAATAIANVNIATLNNGDVVNGTPVVTGDKVSLRFQTTSSQNGIYVVGATEGSTVRDTSQRDGFATPATLKDQIMYVDWYNYNSGSIASSPTESSASHSNDLTFFKQKNDNLTTFTDANYSSSSDVYTIKPPTNAKIVKYEVNPFGGAGGGGTNTRGGAGGCSALPISFSRQITPFNNLQITMALGAKPGTGRTGAGGSVGSANTINIFFAPSTNTTFNGAAGGAASGAASSSPSLSPGGPTLIDSAGSSTAGFASFFGAGGVAGSGGVLGGGGGSASQGSGGSGAAGTAVANSVPANGGFGFGHRFGNGGGGGGSAPASGRPSRGGFGGPGYVKVTWE